VNSTSQFDDQLRLADVELDLASAGLALVHLLTRNANQQVDAHRCASFRPDMELGHSHFVTQRPSDPGIQRPGKPVDPVTLFYNELQMSTYVANVCNGQAICRFGVCTLKESKILKIIC